MRHKYLINRQLLIAIVFLVMSGCKVTGELMSYQYQNMTISTVSDTLNDQEFQAVLAPYKAVLDSTMKKVIAVADIPLESFRPESPLSNLISDLVLDFGKKLCVENNFEFEPQFSLINHGSLRTSIPQGDITLGNIYELMPFENELALLELTGEQVIKLANYLCIRNGEGVAGMTFAINDEKADNLKVQGVMVDPAKKYWMLTSDYIANGGDGMKVLTWASKRVDTGYKMREIIISYLKEKAAKRETISAKSDGRIYYVQ